MLLVLFASVRLYDPLVNIFHSISVILVRAVYWSYMRVIEPRVNPKLAARKRRTVLSRKHGRVVVFVVGFFALLTAVAWWADRTPDFSLIHAVFGDKSKEAAQTDQTPKTIQEFSPDDFRALYTSFAYPNVQEITSPPVITGNALADKRIRDIAEARGYALRSVPVAPISKANEPDLEGDDLLQPLALSAWQDLKASADAAGVPLRLLSGYRSISYQQQLFTQRLVASGAYSVDIANGIADKQVIRVLATTAPPGYSRHHNGYTIDLACYPNGSFVEFAKSSCFEWLRKQNYMVAKEHGWIPSYPEGADAQGPEPEAWEYVWVGRDALVK